jgi:hypothetical protein
VPRRRDSYRNRNQPRRCAFHCVTCKSFNSEHGLENAVAQQIKTFIVCKSGYVIWQAAKFWYGLNAFSLIALGIGLTALQDGALKMVLIALQKRITTFQEARKHNKLKTT